MKCVLEKCENNSFLTFESLDLGDKKYPLCKSHFDEFFESRESVMTLKTILRAILLPSPTAAPVEKPKKEKPPPPPPIEEEEEEWTPAFGG